MKKESQLYLNKADRAIKAAERELGAEDVEFAANWVYYDAYFQDGPSITDIFFSRLSNLPTPKPIIF